MNGLLMRHTLILATAFLFFAMVEPTRAMAQPDPADRVFAMVTEQMNEPRRIQFCAYVAEAAVTLVSEAGEPELMANKGSRLQARIARQLELANARHTSADLQRIERENGEYMGLLSYAPSREIVRRLSEDPENANVAALLSAEVVTRCNTMLDAMGVAQPPPVSAE
jgi:hypothetical protein